MKARIIRWEPLITIITNHVLDKSIIQRNIPLKNLPREEQIRILEGRIINSPILKEDDPIYKELEKGMPKLKKGEMIYYKRDTSSEYPYIYVIKNRLKGKEMMISIRWIREFEEHLTTKMGETAHYN